MPCGHGVQSGPVPNPDADRTARYYNAQFTVEMVRRDKTLETTWTFEKLGERKQPVPMKARFSPDDVKDHLISLRGTPDREGLCSNRSLMSGDRKVRLPALKAAARELEDVGESLFASMCPAFDLVRGDIDDTLASGSGLRIVLATDSPGLEQVPWELAWIDGWGSHLVLTPGISIVRSGNRALESVSPVEVPEFSVLFVDATRAVSGGGLDELPGGSLLRAGISRSLLVQPKLATPKRWTKKELEQGIEASEASDRPATIFHFSGHGRSGHGDEPASILLSGRSTRREDPPRDYMTASNLSASLKGGHTRLAVIAACDSAADVDWFGFGSTLLEDVPAAVSMQSRVSDMAADLFAKALYDRLVAGEHLDDAVGAGRRAIYEEFVRSRDPESTARMFPDWWQPVLHTRFPALHFRRPQGDSVSPGTSLSWRPFAVPMYTLDVDSPTVEPWLATLPRSYGQRDLASFTVSADSCMCAFTTSEGTLCVGALSPSESVVWWPEATSLTGARALAVRTVWASAEVLLTGGGATWVTQLDDRGRQHSLAPRSGAAVAGIATDHGFLWTDSGGRVETDGDPLMPEMPAVGCRLIDAIRSDELLSIAWLRDDDRVFVCRFEGASLARYALRSVGVGDAPVSSIHLARQPRLASAWSVRETNVPSAPYVFVSSDSTLRGWHWDEMSESDR
jgi:hypothetical protein